MLGLAAIGVAIAGLQVAFAFGVAAVITALIAGGDGAMAAWALVVLGVIALLRGGLVWVREALANRAGAAVRIGLRRRLLDRLTAIPVAERDAGAAAAAVIDGVESLDPYVTRYLPQLLVVLVVPATVVAIVGALNPAAGWILGAAAAVAVLAPRAWDLRLLRNGRARWDRFSRLSSDYVEALQQIPLLRAFGATGRTAARLTADADELRRSTMAQLRSSLVETALSTLAMQLGVVAAALAALHAVLAGETDPGTAVAVLMLSRECFRPVQELSANWHAGYLGLTAVDSLDRVLARTPESHRDGDHRLAATVGRVSFDDVAFRYPGTDAGVTGVSFTAEPGETIALIGASGSGKSTLARLLERDLEPDSGSIRIDGVALPDYSATARAHSAVVVPQDPVLFTWTVRDNLRLYRPEASEDEIEAAARAADIHEVVQALPDGYATVLAENGAQLSGGQRQRLAIARALLSPAPVLVLDEATSALDLGAERRVVDALAARRERRTTILIAHRDTACVHATRWIALERGRISGTGAGAPTAALQPEAGRR